MARRVKTFPCAKCCENFPVAELQVCTKCGNLFCGQHIYTYVDGNNRSITENAPPYCEECYKETYK